MYEAAASGGQIGPQVELRVATVNDGLFTVLLDFGGSAFGASARWLEIEVSTPAGSGSCSLLSPRQRVTPAPQALFALGPWVQSGNAVSYNGQVGINTQNPAWPLHVPAGQAVGPFQSQVDPNRSVIELRNDAPGATLMGAINFNNAAGTDLG
jgi:hypothetical protein